MPQVEVTFDIDANGILNVTARDKATGREQKVTITASTNLNKGEIDRMVQEARQNEAEDRKRRELVEARNNADSLAYQTEKTLNELGDKVPAGERQNIQSQDRWAARSRQGRRYRPDQAPERGAAERLPRPQPAALRPAAAG